jgi:uncharacterized protein (TIGR01777 family)
MQIVIAGGNGYIGRMLTRELLDAGHRITWLSHRPGRAEELGFRPEEILDVIFEYHDEQGTWVEEVATADVVVNLSGYPIATRWNAKVKHLLRESRIDTTRALVDAIGMARDDALSGPGPKALVNASAIGIYGDRGETVLDESATPGKDWLSQLAVDWEAEAYKAEKLGVRVVTVRTGIVLGETGFLPKLVTPMKFFVGGPVGPGTQWVSWVHADDARGIFRYAIGNDRLSGPVNTSPAPVTMHDLAHAVGHVLRRPSWMPAPTAMLRVILGEVAPYTVFSQRSEPKALAEAGYPWRQPELGAALQNLLGKRSGPQPRVADEAKAVEETPPKAEDPAKAEAEA